MKKKIGIVGGLSPESTIYYYQYITRKYTEEFGDFGYPEVVIYSVNFQNYVDWGKDDNWKAIEDDLVSAIKALQSAGAEFGIIATNTMHYVFDSVEKRVNIPLLSLVDAVCGRAKQIGINKIALLGTKFTMEKDFYPKALTKVGIETIVPNDEQRKIVNEIIFHELTKGIIKEESKNRYLEIIIDLAKRGAQGVILGCTEIPLLIRQDDVEITVLDSSLIHAEVAYQYAME